MAAQLASVRPTSPADKRTLRALAKVEERSDQQHIDVEFERPEPSPTPEGPAPDVAS